MPSVNSNKKDRIQIRIDLNAKKTIERAAHYSRKSISEFVISQSLAAAEELIREHENITLSGADWELFYNMLVKPPKPNETLKAAYEQYQKVK